jgi:hypothetical protein
MKKSITFFEKLYSDNLCNLSNDKFLSLDKIQKHLNKFKCFSRNVIGKSVNGLPIYSFKVGTGKIKILIWSQMHGNETTSTKAVLDLLNTFNNECCYELNDNLSIYIIPVLNPDGALNYTRENLNKVDLNRDAISLSQPESRALNDYFNKIQPDYCFNMHDQRTIYGCDNNKLPTCLSFLSPSYDMKSSVNNTRKKSMNIIEAIYNNYSSDISNMICLYDDTYNENCFGDKFQKSGSSTVLFESGFFSNDYLRIKTRKYIYISLFISLFHIIYPLNYKKQYSEISKNKNIFFDIIINVKSFDIGLNYKEVLISDKIEFYAIVDFIGDLSRYESHKKLNISDLRFNINLNSIKIGDKLNYLNKNVKI